MSPGQIADAMRYAACQGYESQAEADIVYVRLQVANCDGWYPLRSWADVQAFFK